MIHYGVWPEQDNLSSHNRPIWCNVLQHDEATQYSYYIVLSCAMTANDSSASNCKHCIVSGGMPNVSELVANKCRDLAAIVCC